MLVFLLWVIPHAAAQSDPQSDATEWHIRLREAEKDYLLLINDWRIAFEESAGSGESRAAVYLSLLADEESARIKRDALRQERDALDRQRSTINEGLEARKTHLDDMDRQIDEKRAALQRSVQDLMLALDDTKRGSRAYRALLDWWEVYRGVDWDAVLSGATDPTRPYLLALEDAIVPLGDAPRSALSSVQRIAHEEYVLRQTRSQYLLRTADEDLQSLTVTLALKESELRHAEDALARVRAQLAEQSQQIGPNRDAALVERTRGLQAVYGGLLHLLETDANMQRSPVAREPWCQLMAHGGVVNTLLEDPVGEDLLRNAAAAYGGPCTSVIGADLDVPLVQVAWAQALFMASSQEPIWLIVENGAGVWTLDGEEITGPGPTRLRVAAGTHRLAFDSRTPEGARDGLIEDLRPEEYIGVRLENDRIRLDRLPPNTAEWIVAVRHEVFIDEVELRPEQAGLWRVGSSITLMGFDSRPHLGATIEGGYALYRARTFEVELGAAFDGLWSSQSYAYGRGSTPALLRFRVPAGIRMTRGKLRPTATLAPGFIPPFQAITLDTQVGLGVPLGHTMLLSAKVGWSSSFWRGGASWLEPMAQLGVSTWF